MKNVTCYRVAYTIFVVTFEGRQIISALENSVSQYPSLEGRFAQVAGVRFGFDSQLPPGQRIDPENVKVQGFPLGLEQVKCSAGENSISQCVCSAE